LIDWLVKIARLFDKEAKGKGQIDLLISIKNKSIKNKSMGAKAKVY